MKITFKKVALIIVLCVALFPLSDSVFAAEKKYPTGPITLNCGFGPGGTTDLLNRALAQALEKQLGVPVIPGNKPGSGGMVGASFLANARPDGYTMAMMIPEHIIKPILQELANYTLKDFYVIGQFAQFSNVLAVPADAPWKTFQEFVDYARKNPGVKYGHPGVGTGVYLRAENLNKHAGLKMVGVPFKSDPESMAALLGKHIPIGVYALSGAKPQVAAGKLRIIFSFDRAADFGLDPSIPDLRSMYKDLTDIDISQLLVIPANTPQKVIKVLKEALQRATKDPEFAQALQKLDSKIAYVDGDTVMQEMLPKRMSQVKSVLQYTGVIK